MADPPSAPLDRLSEALSIYESWLADPVKPTREELLAGHPDLAELLQPLLGEPPPLAAEDADVAPRYVGDFRIVREIGRGGMGVVYEAEQSSLRRRVALKVLPAHSTLTPRSIARFRREAAAVAGVQHPGLVPVFSVGQDDDTHYFTMELVDGRGLDVVLSELRARCDGDPSRLGPVDLRQGVGTTLAAQAAELVRRCADALAAAHARGVVHRDVKPHNVLLERSGQPRLVDFGLAKSDELPGVSRSGELVGTPQYMTPEQVEGRETDVRTDVFALGIVLYELITLRTPFDAPSRHGILDAICARSPIPPRRINLRVPRDLETICLKALEKDPAHRYRDARGLADELGRFLDHEPIEAEPPTTATRIWKSVRRHPARASALALAAALVLGGPLAYGIVQQQHLRELAARQEETVRERDRAAANLRQARSALREQLQLLADAVQRPDVELIYESIARGVLRQSEALAGEGGNHAALSSELAAAHSAVAQMLVRQGRRSEANPHLEAALRALPEDAHTRRADLFALRAKADYVAGETEAARRDAESAFAHWRLFIDATPTDPSVDEERAEFVHALAQSAQTESQLGAAERAQTLVDEAEQVWSRVPAEVATGALGLGSRQNLLQARLQLANLRGDAATALAILDEIDTTLARYVALQPDNPLGDLWRVDALRERGLLARRSGDADACATALRTAVEHARALTVRFPRIPAYRELLASSLQELGGALFQRSEVSAATALAQEAVVLYEELTAAYQPTLALRDQLARACNSVAAGLLVDAGADPAEVEAAVSRACDVQRGLLESHPGEPRFRSAMAATLLNRLDWQARRGDFEGAMASADEAIEVLTVEPRAAALASVRTMLLQCRLARCALSAVAGRGEEARRFAKDVRATRAVFARERLSDAAAIARTAVQLHRDGQPIAAELAAHGADLVESAIADEPALADRAAALAVLREIAGPRGEKQHVR